MSSLVPFELRPGRRVRIDRKTYTILATSSKTAAVSLIDEKNARRQVSRSELAALVVLERAEMVDELEVDESEEDADSWRRATNIMSLEAHRIVDWLSKMFLVRQMLRVNGSPRTRFYRDAYARACTLLTESLERIGYFYCNTWSVWTIYHDVLRLRRHKYRVAALQRKGVEYTPHKRKNAAFEEVKKHVQQRLLARPQMSVANVHREVNRGAQNVRSE